MKQRPVSGWIDISVPLRNGMVHWPGDPKFHLSRVMEQDRGDVCTVSKIELCVHTGTHMDAPLHFLENGAAIDQMPIDATVGRARVIETDAVSSIGRDDLLAYDLQPGERILFKTANSNRCWNGDGFVEDFVFIARDGAEYLAQCGIRAVGVDYLSIGGFQQDATETHQAILGAGIWVIEGLDLRTVRPGDYELICLPLKLIGSDGAPARAILRSLH